MEESNIKSLNESIFYENENIIISSENNKILKEKAKVCITSKNIFLDNLITISYEELIFHAINKEKNFVLLSTTKNIPDCKNNTINLKSEKKEEIKNLYDSITKGINNYNFDDLDEEKETIENIKINDNKKEKEENINDSQNQINNELKLIDIQSQKNITLDNSETDWKIAIEPRRKLSSNNDVRSLMRGKPLGFDVVNFALKKIHIGRDITDENFKTISSYCNDKIKTKKNKNKISGEIADFLKKNFGNDWFVIITDIKSKIVNNYDFKFSFTKKDSTMIFIINNYKFNIICS